MAVIADGRIVVGPVLAVCLALAGCGAERTSASQGDAAAVAELSVHDNQPCPHRMAQEEDGGHGFGPEEPAQESPSLATPTKAWICVYHPTEAGTTADGHGARFAWVRRGTPVRVTGATLASLNAHLPQLEPAAADRGCTADLGARYAFVYAVNDDLTAVVVDDYGCGDVRLTDDPYTTEPGRATAPGTVSGVLSGPSEFADALVAAGKPR